METEITEQIMNKVSYEDMLFKIWNDLTSSISPLSAIILLTVVYICIKYASNIGEAIKTVFYFIINKKQFKHKTKKDLEKHQIFKDLLYWKEYSVDQCFAPGDIVKLKIAKEVLRINLTTTYKWLKASVDNVEKIVEGNTRKLLGQDFEKLAAIQWTEYKKRGIPDAFLRKFSDVNSVAKNFIQDRMNDLLAEDMNLDIYDRLYLVLGSLNTYYGTLLTDLPRTVQALNGDLRGCVFDGEVIGGADTVRCYLPPNLSYKTPALNRLNELIHSSKCARACVFVFHDYIEENILDGKVSAVYEAVAPGVSPITAEVSYIDVTPLTNIVQRLLKHEKVLLNTRDADADLAQILHHQGVQVLLAQGIWIKDKLVGALVLAWLNEDIMSFVDMDQVQKTIEEYALKLSHYVDYGFNQDDVTKV